MAELSPRCKQCCRRSRRGGRGSKRPRPCSSSVGDGAPPRRGGRGCGADAGTCVLLRGGKTRRQLRELGQKAASSSRQRRSRISAPSLTWADDRDGRLRRAATSASSGRPAPLRSIGPMAMPALGSVSSGRAPEPIWLVQSVTSLHRPAPAAPRRGQMRGRAPSRPASARSSAASADVSARRSGSR